MSVPALTISATELGGYAGFRFCARCAWIRMHLRPLPWQGFPGIFSSIDRFTKQVIVNHLERESASLHGWTVSAKPSSTSTLPLVQIPGHRRCHRLHPPR